MASVVLMSLSASTQAAEMNLATAPLYLGTQVDPNVFFMLDDSGSMDWETLTVNYEYYTNYWGDNQVAKVTSGRYLGYSSTGGCSGRRDYAYIFDESDNAYNSCTYPVLEDQPQVAERDWRIFSSDLNVMYYDPSVTYEPWVGFSNATFSAARSNPQSGTDGYSDTRNLNGFIFESFIDDHGYVGNQVNGPNDVTDGANGQVDLFDSHVRYTVNTGSLVAATHTTLNAAGIQALPNCNAADSTDNPPYEDCYGTVLTTTTISGATTDPWGRTLADVQQNVANWYQYHRRRSFVAKAATAAVVAANASFRYGVGLINEYDDLFYEVPSSAVSNYSSHNAAMLSALFSFEWESNGTPLRRGLERVGRYYDKYYGSYADPIIASCQQNYSVLLTDGYWNGSAPNESEIGDEDGDSHNDTVADVAHYYYTKDLSGLPDQVPTSSLDDNNKQHMVTFTVAFGVTGNLVDSDNDGYPNPTLDEDDDWGNAHSSNAEKIDDLWHAAFNSKGEYVSAQSPNDVAQGITDALAEIADRVGSSASVATNTGSLNAGSHLFQARFDSSDWKGQLLAYPINLDGSIAATPAWDAGTMINAQNFDTGRKIITWNPEADVIAGGSPEGQSIPFRFPSDYTSPNALTDLSPDQIADLLTQAPFPVTTTSSSEIADNQAYGEALVNYLRGDSSNEGTASPLSYGFRSRNSVLGDIVNSDPKFVGAPAFRYPNDMEPKPYGSFKSGAAGRDGVVYVGANDGMLHGFDEDTGAEVLAFLPGSVYENLYRLAKPDYLHRYFVDAGPNIVDAYLANTPDPGGGGTGVWRTILSAGLGGGGQSIYTLDVTDPTIFSEANASSIALWEFDDSDDPDLGYTFVRPQIAKMANGKWAAVFGNGYNNTEADGNASTTGHGALFIVDLETGALIKKIDTEAGSSGTPNGLATPLMIDEDNDFIVDYIYAGDLLGNLWKFDVNDANAANWDVAYRTAGNPQPLFTTEANQPITSQPQAAFHPNNLGGFMLFFGTGKYLELTDNTPVGQTTQAFYGVWDQNQSTLAAFDSSDLLLQTIDNQYFSEFDTDADGTDDTGFTLRDVSDNYIDWSTHMGWKLNLIPENVSGSPNTYNFGERQVSNSIIRNGRVIFTTLSPSQSECDFGGTSFLMQLDFRDGSVLNEPAFDLNGDGKYNDLDTDASGRASDVGIMPTVSILSDGAQDIAFGSGASGDIDVIQLNVGSDSYGRQSWRQLDQ